MTCCQCEHHARFVGWRPKKTASLFDPLVVLLSYCRCRLRGTSLRTARGPAISLLKSAEDIG